MVDKLSLRKKLSFQFKGERNYIQGGDIFNSVLSELKMCAGKSSWIDFIVFRGFTDKVCEVVFGQDNLQEDERVKARFRIANSNCVSEGYVVETDVKVEGRREYQEEEIVKTGVVTGVSIVQSSRVGFSPVEEVIALTKFLHNTLFPLEAGKWVFTQLKLNRPFSESPYPFVIEIKNNLAGKMTVSTIMEADKDIGEIRFTVAKI